MLVTHQRLSARSSRWDEELHLTYETHSKSRLHCFAVSGEEVGLSLERGQPPLADGNCLEARDGRLMRVIARSEHLLHVTCASPPELTRAVYHPGNRHVALQVDDGRLHLLDDYVLKAMLGQLGVTVEVTETPLQQEHGAYDEGHHHSHHGEAKFNYAPCLYQFGVRR